MNTEMGRNRCGLDIATSSDSRSLAEIAKLLGKLFRITSLSLLVIKHNSITVI
jgi:hypothetical protein